MKLNARLVPTLIALLGLAGASLPPARTSPAVAGTPAPPAAATKAKSAETPAAAAASADSAGAPRRTPELYLAWRAPYGTPGVVTNVPLRGSEAAQPETLYLSFDPGRDADKFYGMDCTLLFRVPIGDTLGSLWRFGGGSKNRRNIQIEFPTDDSWGCPRPFQSAGFGAPNYRFGTESGELQIIYAVPVEHAAPIRTGRRYCFGRVIFPAGSTLDERDGQAVCVEWVKGDFGFALEGDGTTVLGRPVERFVSVNSPGVKVCASFRQAPGTWAPEGSKPR